jgi:hypothetical protein
MSTVNREITARARAERLSLIRDELLPRIRPLCLDMPNDLFLELVEAMAEVQLKYELHENSRAVALDDGPVA